MFENVLVEAVVIILYNFVYILLILLIHQLKYWSYVAACYLVSVILSFWSYDS